MTDSKHPVWQKLMDEAYERWNDGADLAAKSKREFLDALPEGHRVAVAIGNLNYQVENGGFEQWVDNGYANASMDLLTAYLAQIEGPEGAVGRILDELEPHVKCGQRDRGFGSDFWQNSRQEIRVEWTTWDGEEYVEESEELELTEEIKEALGIEVVDGRSIAQELDDRYYELKDEFLDQVEAFLQQYKDEPSGAPEKKPVGQLVDACWRD